MTALELIIALPLIALAAWAGVVLAVMVWRKDPEPVGHTEADAPDETPADCTHRSH